MRIKELLEKRTNGAGLRLRADLHTHSLFSDGYYSPSEVCRRAAENGVELLSVTDHDSMNGEEEKRAAAAQYGLVYVSGWEISAYEGEHKIHILGYGCKRDENYEKFTRERKELGLLRAQDSVEKLRSAGIFLTLKDAENRRADPTSPVHTMHVAQAAALASGKSAGEVYAEYLAPGKIAHSALGRPTPREAIDCIHACGGLASVAHPGRISLPFHEREKLLEELAEYGVDGIEATYTTHTDTETDYFRALAKRLGLFATGGSDTHEEGEGYKIGNPAFYPSAELLGALARRS